MDRKIIHKSGKAAFVPKGPAKIEGLQMRRKCAGNAAGQVDAAEGELDQGQIAANRTQYTRKYPCGVFLSLIHI